MAGIRELVVCSLEPWDDVWRRNQFFVDILLKRNPELRILYVEPAHSWRDRLRGRRRFEERPSETFNRLHLFRPTEAVPRRIGAVADTLLARSVVGEARRLEFTEPVLWLNDASLAPLTQMTDWPAVFDITDDWLLAPFPPRELERQRRREELIFEHVKEVVVCSKALAKSRAGRRSITVIPNGVDLEHFQRPYPRPADLPESPVAVYVGSLHEARLDTELLVRLADAIPELRIALVGPDALKRSTHERLASLPQVELLGTRPYSDVPAYLQHANVIVVPHVVSPFTESLDPIKAYECLAVGTPTVATPVAGFRSLGSPIACVPPESFADAVALALQEGQRHPTAVATWSDRAAAFEHILLRAASTGSRTAVPTP
jgi:teichuronic acid biosynthesis glycosyltransferase TuaH